MIYQGEGVEVLSGPFDEDGNRTEHIGPSQELYHKMLPITHWSVWFAEGELWELKRYDSADYEWDELPGEGVLALCNYHPPKFEGGPIRKTWSWGYDWYQMKDKTRRLKGRCIPDPIMDRYTKIIYAEAE